VIRSSLLVFALAVSVLGFNTPQLIGDRFDSFGDVNCEIEMARLDSFAVQLQNEPRARGAIMFFAGKMVGDKLPKRGEAEARAERIRSYLTKRRGIPPARLVVMNGGYTSNFQVQLWMVPAEAGLPKREAFPALTEIQYRKGKLNPRDYRCGI
jgi:hypothetical protein